MNTVFNQRQDNKLKSENIIYCLEFLAQDAIDSELPCIHDIIKTSITEIIRRDSIYGRSNSDVKYYDILNAFKSFVKFCLIKDNDAKKQIIEFLEHLDEEALMAYEDSPN